MIKTLRTVLPDRLGIASLPVPVLVYLLVVCIPIRFQLGPLQMTGLRLFLACMIIPLIINFLRGKYGRFRLADGLLALSVIWSAIAISQTSPGNALENAGSNVLEVMGGYLLARAFVRTRQDFVGLIYGLAILIVLTLPLAISETLTGRPILIELIHKLPLIHSVTIVGIEARLGLERIQVLFAHPIHYGLFCSTAASLFFVGLAQRHNQATRLTVLFCVSACCFLALSSGAFLALLLQLFLIAWAWTFRFTNKRWALLLFAIVLAYVAVSLLSNRTPLRVFFSYATFSAHNAYWRGIIFHWGMINVWANPIFGIGLNDWVRPSFMRSGSMDNFWLVIAVRYGIPAFVLLLGAYLATIWRVALKDLGKDTELNQLRRAWIFCLVGLTFTLCTVHIWTAVYSFVFFLLGCGHWFLDTSGTTSREDNQKLELQLTRLIGTTFSRPKGTAA